MAASCTPSCAKWRRNKQSTNQGYNFHMHCEKILVTVRTYPTISTKYKETVCTGGVTDHGEWRRLYPVPLRYLGNKQQYKTFDVITVKVKSGKDGRPETRTPDNTSIQIHTHLKEWSSRCEWINNSIFDSLQEMMGEERTIGPVRVRKVLDFVAKPESPDWSKAEKDKLRQLELFDSRKPLEKIPFDFRLIWQDGNSVEHNTMFKAWEVGQTWRQYQLSYDDPIQVMREKWLNDICGSDRDISFFMGNLAAHRRVFMVCGIFNPPKKVNTSETLW